MDMNTLIQEFRKRFVSQTMSERPTNSYGEYLTSNIKAKDMEQFILSSMRSLLDRVEREVDGLVVSALFNNDMRWTLIREMIKMRAPISPDDAEYYRKPFKDMQAKLTSLKAEVEGSIAH